MGEAAKKDDEKEEKFVPVGPGADEVPPEESAEKDDAEDERLAQSKDDPEGDDKPRKHESSKERRDRAKKAHARDRHELEYWRKRGEVLEKRFMENETRLSQTETSAIDQRINTVSGQLASARRVMADAMKAPNGTGADQYEEALRIYDELREQLGELKGSKKLHELRSQERIQQHTQVREEPGEVRPHPRVVTNARGWAAQHKWFSFDGKDEDSVIVRAIDEALAADGYDPTEDDYWDELTSRVKRRLPERFKKDARARPDDDADDDGDDDDRPARSSGPKFSSGGRDRPLKKGEVYVSAERKQAMKEYGVWDDPVARNRMLKKYAQWDAETVSNKR